MPSAIRCARARAVIVAVEQDRARIDRPHRRADRRGRDRARRGRLVRLAKLDPRHLQLLEPLGKRREQGDRIGILDALRMDVRARSGCRRAPCRSPRRPPPALRSRSAAGSRSSRHIRRRGSWRRRAGIGRPDSRWRRGAGRRRSRRRSRCARPSHNRRRSAGCRRGSLRAPRHRASCPRRCGRSPARSSPRTTDRLAAAEIGMDQPAHVPQLRDDPPAGVMHGVGDRLPALDLRVVPQAGRIRPAEPFAADPGRFGDDQPGARALRIIGRHQRVGHRFAVGTAPGSAAPSQFDWEARSRRAASGSNKVGIRSPFIVTAPASFASKMRSRVRPFNRDSDGQAISSAYDGRRSFGFRGRSQGPKRACEPSQAHPFAFPALLSAAACWRSGRGWCGWPASGRSPRASGGWRWRCRSCS